VQARTLADYVKEANERPGGMPYGTSGIGGAGHLAGELLKLMAKANLVHVPYKAAAGDERHTRRADPSMIATPHCRAARESRQDSRARDHRDEAIDLLSRCAAGRRGRLPGFEAVNWYAYVAPAKTPKEIVDRWNREIVKVLNTQETREQLLANGMEPTLRRRKSSPATWSASSRPGRVVKEAGIQAE